jgi:hypothetical protein
LLQGRPRPREGGMFKWTWWKMLDAVPAVGSLVRYWDLAGTEPKGKGHDPDFSAGVLMCRMADDRTAIVDVQRFRKSVNARDVEVERIARDDLRNNRARLGRKSFVLSHSRRQLRRATWSYVRVSGETPSGRRPLISRTANTTTR